jgi:NAD(P)H-flavin reductase
MESGAERRASGDALLPNPWFVRRVVREATDVVSLEIEPATGVAMEPPRPGQFQMLYAFGVGEAPISVAGVGNSGRVLHTVRDVGAVTRALCNLAPGDTLGARGPFGSGWPMGGLCGRDVLLAAGGIGMAPLRPVVESILARRDQYDDVVVLYGARGPQDLLYPQEYETWREGGIQVELTVDHADHGWQAHVGVVTTLIRHARFDAEQVTAFLCGPEVMMHFTAEALTQRDVAAHHVFLSMERNMKCAVGLCGHCQLGPEFLCTNGPVFEWPRIRDLMAVREL